MKSSIRRFRLAFVTAFLAGCAPTSPTPSILQVQVAPGTGTISPGQSLRIVATVTTNPSGGAYAVTWTSSNAQAASVDSTGLALGVAASPAVSICATASSGNARSNVQACATLVVQPVPVCSGPTGSLTPAADTMHVGDVAHFQIPAAQLSGRSPSEIRWTVDFPATAGIDSLTGVVTAVAVGGTDVIATDPLLTSPCPHVWKAVVIVR
jgi:uncharacterized protein YjdB